MKMFLLLFASLSFLSTSGVSATTDLNSIEAQNMAIGIMDTLKNQGEFADTDETTLGMAKEIIQTIVSDPNLLQDFKNGDLVLDEQFVADYFLTDTFRSVKDAVGGVLKPVKSLGSTILKPIKDVGSLVFDTVKKLSAGIASIANKTLSAITNNDAVMFLLETGVGIFNKLIPFGANALGLALLFVPGAEVLIPVIAVATPILMKVITPDNVTLALKVAAATASLADSFLNPEKASYAPRSAMLSLEKKVKNRDRKTAGEAMELTLKGGRALQQYIKNSMKSGEWDKLPKSTRQKLLSTADKVNKATALIDAEKLK